MIGTIFLGLSLFGEKAKESSARSQINKYYRDVSKMDVWDGIEKQVRECMESYNMNYDWYMCGAYWKGNKRKWDIFNIITINANREYLKSGLSMEDFAEAYFLNVYKEKGKYAFHGGWSEYYKTLKLYDDDGNATTFMAYDMHGKDDSGKSCPVISVYKDGNIIAKVPVV